MSFEKLVSYRACGHEGVEKFLWVTKDRGAYGNENDGPLFDWISESADFMSQVKNFDVVVQAGGNCGMYPRFYKNYFREVYTFEPDDLNFYCLDRNCEGEGYHKFHGGLGNTTDSLTLKVNSLTNVGMHKTIDQKGNVKMYRIDDLNLNNCDLIHLDIEGYEAKAILGARETIERFSPVVITERNGGEKELLNLGYTKFKKLRMDSIYIKV
jgi:FkbM family methyltransferase